VLAFRQLAAAGDEEFENIRADIVTRPKGMSNEEFEAHLIEQSFIESEQREITQKDVIWVCTSLYNYYGDVKLVAKELGRTSRYVSKFIKYARLIPELKKLVDSGQLNLNHALRLQDLCTDDFWVIDNAKAVGLAKGAVVGGGKIPTPIFVAAGDPDNANKSPDEIIEVAKNPPPKTTEPLLLDILLNVFARLKSHADEESQTIQEAAINLIMNGLEDSSITGSQPEEDEGLFSY